MPHRAKSQTLCTICLLQRVWPTPLLVQSTNLLLQGILKAMSLQTEQNLGNLNKMENRQEMENSMEESSQMLEQSESESENPKEPSLFIVYENARFGGPFGVFSATCKNCLLLNLDPRLEVLMEFPGKGHLVTKLKKELNLYGIKKGLPFFDATIEDILAGVGSVLVDELDIQKCAHYASMDVKD